MLSHVHGEPLAQRAKHWPADLVVHGTSPTGGGNPFKHKESPFI